MPAVLLTPLFVQIDEHVQPPVEFQLRVHVEVNVNVQESTRLDLMQSASAEIGIGDQAVDSGQSLQKEQHLEPIHGVEKTSDLVADRARLMKVAQLLLQRVVEAAPLHLRRRRELAKNGIERRILEQPIEDDVRERMGARVLRMERVRVELESRRRVLHRRIVEYAAVPALPYRDFFFPLNVFMYILNNEEGEVRYLHYALFERPDETIADAQERSTRKLLSLLDPPPHSILDVGIGLGTTLDLMTRLGYDAEGITPDENQVAVARSRYSGIRIHQSAFETFSPGRRYDCIVFQESAQYIDSGRLFAKASDLTDHVIVLDEFSMGGGSLHRLDLFLASASLHGFGRVGEIDVSGQAAPTIDYFIERLPRYRGRLVSHLGITNEQVDGLIESGNVYREMYRSGAYVYRLLRFRAGERAGRPQS